MLSVLSHIGRTILEGGGNFKSQGLAGRSGAQGVSCLVEWHISLVPSSWTL